MLGKHFESVFTSEPDNMALPTILPSQFPTMQNIEISVNGVEQLLKKIEPGKATGPDNIQAILLKETAPEISPISHPYLQSISTIWCPSQ